eukprot:CAMPEP_0182478148 /NCGR_PEP_ID=MMETSP1319-20130603/32054_1 /TAXON_ID=172717 /ORGANISM="Bolidomonas pacifica, Strain RCC208" /LENGTH=44 /DNA_ID= /DNA_START= /DNA_END= /DNA_ORIENTATION=
MGEEMEDSDGQYQSLMQHKAQLKDMMRQRLEACGWADDFRSRCR